MKPITAEECCSACGDSLDMVGTETRYACGGCGNLHNEEDDAILCCGGTEEDEA